MLCHAMLYFFFRCFCCCRCTRTATFDGLRVKTLYTVEVYINIYTQYASIYLFPLHFRACSNLLSLSLQHTIFQIKFYVLDTLKWILLCTHAHACCRRDTICDTYRFIFMYTRGHKIRRQNVYDSMHRMLSCGGKEMCFTLMCGMGRSK